jgi:hypothetical protein
MPAVMLEAVLLAPVLAVALVRPGLASAFFELAQRTLGALARRRGLAVLTVGVTVVVARLALLPLVPIPQPDLHDEFSHLLAAETFASGRLTNPTPPMSEHFESFHIIVRPTYMGMYPPAQGVVLAAGSWLGHPWIGVLLSVALACAAICWMLQGWLPPTWAFLGGMLAVVRFGLTGYWINSYMGGAVAAAGGALILGALPRIRTRLRPRDALLLGLGLVALANSRAYEGLVLSLPVAVALLGYLVTSRRVGLKTKLIRVVLPLVVVLTVAGLSMGYYFWRVTGSPMRMPYEVNRSTYATAPIFLWQAPRPEPSYHHPVMRDFFLRFERATYEDEVENVEGFLLAKLAVVAPILAFYVGPALLLPVLMFPRVLRDRRIRFLVVTGLVTGIGLAVEVFFLPHYAAPLTAVILAVIVQSLRLLWVWRWCGAPAGRFLVRALPVLSAAVLVLRLAAPALGLPLTEPTVWWLRLSPSDRALDRAHVLAALERRPGRHLVVVRYGPAHDPLTRPEWVYNHADLDHAKVIWAREIDPARTMQLAAHYSDRQLWLVEPDRDPRRVRPYSGQTHLTSP